MGREAEKANEASSRAGPTGDASVLPDAAAHDPDDAHEAASNGAPPPADPSWGSAPTKPNGGDDRSPPDPFARLADALPNRPPPSHRRLPSPRRSRPSLSDLAPVLPPAKPSSHPATVTALTTPPPRQVVGPPLPSVIVEDPPFDESDVPTRPGRFIDPPTLPGRGRRPRERGPTVAVVVAVLAVSLGVFGLGLFALLSR